MSKKPKKSAESTEPAEDAKDASEEFREAEPEEHARVILSRVMNAETPEHFAPDLIHYKSIRFVKDFNTNLGGASAGGTLNCSTLKRQSNYFAHRIPGDSIFTIGWKSQTDGLLVYDVPLSQVESATRIPDDDEPADLR